MRISFILVSLLLAAPAVAQTQVTLVAEDSKCISSVSSANWNDNRLRAYWNSASQGFVDGFVRFDVTNIPDSATITGLTLRVYHEQGFSNPLGNPEVNCYRVDDDTWTRGATDPYPGIVEQLTPSPLTGFPSAALVPVDFVLDSGAANWTADLLDDKLSLALRNENGNIGVYSYVYFHGSDVTPAPPELIVDYVSGPSLAYSGTLGSTLTFDYSGFTANAQIATLYGPAGSLSGNAPCGSVTVDLTPINFPPPSQVILLTADANGAAQLSRIVPSAAAGLRVQAVDLSSCDVSNYVTL
jgi:hypothetical protein